MNNKKVLSAAILLILAKSALGIEVESNNDSKLANKLGAENVGKLNKASDVDFFSVDSCVKDDKKQCVKYTAADEKLNPLNKAGTDKRREEVSLSFTCNNRSAATNTNTGLPPVTTTGWFLGIHDSNGELQETYPVSPADCIISDIAPAGFNFRFSSLDSSNYYVSVVSDCAAPPIYNTVTDPKDPTKTIVNVNKFVTAALATQKNIDAVKAEVVTAQAAIDKASEDLSSSSFAVINSNANIQKLSDAIDLVSDITSIASSTLTPATNVSASLSTAKAVGIAAYAMRYSIYTYGQFLLADAAAKNPSIVANIEAADKAVALATTVATQAADAATAADAAVTEAKSAVTAATTAYNTALSADVVKPNVVTQTKADLDTAKKDLTTANATQSNAKTAKTNADNAKTLAENAQKAADNVKTKLEQALTDATAKDTDAQTKLTEALKAVDDAVKSLNDTVKANIDAANTAENFSKRFDSACKDNYNVNIYTLKDNPDNEIQRLDEISSKPQTNLGLESSGTIKTITDNNVYVVESDGTSEIPLVFTCSAMAARQTNDWKLSIFNDVNGLVNSTLINGSTCGSGIIGDKGGYSFKLPKGSQRYYLSVESACVSSVKKGCEVEKAEYSILRDVEKVYAGKLSTTLRKITDTSADFILTNCGLNKNSTITLKAENVDLTEAKKVVLSRLPINVQIGGTACRILTPELSTKNAISGTVADSSEIVDSPLTAKDSVKITLGDCGSDKSKITLTGSKLDLVDFNPNSALSEVVIPIKVNIGDFNCETKEVFSIDNTSAGTTYSNVPDAAAKAAADAAAKDTADAAAAAEKADPIISKLASAKNIGVSQQNSLKLATDVHAYYVDMGIKSVSDFEFSCPTSTRFANDWKLSIYDESKKLVGTPLVINGSDCGTGLVGDSGTLLFSLPKDSPRSYVVITSACDAADKNCEVDKSKYEIKRLLSNTTATSSTAPCFHGVCDTVIETDFPVFGGK